MNYYVDNTVSAPGDGTAWGRAWNSFSAIDWSVIRPGDTVYISGGSSGQTYRETLTVGTSGSLAGAVTITQGVDPGHDGKVTIDGAGTLDNGVVLYDRDHVVVSGLDVRNIRDAGFSVKYAEAGVVIEGNSVHSGDPGGGNARGYDVRSSAGTNAVVVRGNEYTTPAFTNAQTDGIYSMDNDGVVFEKNKIVISNNSTYGHSDAFQSFQDRNVIVRDNWFEQANTAAYNNHGAWMENTRDGGTIKFYNNVVLAPNLTGDAAVSHYMRAGWTQTGTADIWNNTLVGGGRTVYLDNSPQAEVYNNIIQPAAGGHAAVVLNAAPPAANINGNLAWSPTGVTYYTGSGNLSWSQWKALGYEASGVNADPRFAGAAAGDYTLSTGSSAIDRGLTLAAITTDHRGVTRAGAYDIGAYEMNSITAGGSAGGTAGGTTGGTQLALGTGPDTLVLRISQDAYNGDAQYTISVDGVQIGGPLTAKALHALGQSDVVTIRGDWAVGPHTVSVNFVNDAYGGTPGADRNLHVDGATYNGTAVSTAAQHLYSNGAASFQVADATPSARPVSGMTVRGTSGGDVLTGSAGNDTIDAGRGNDTITGGRGDDRITAGRGADIVVFNLDDGRDVITDFATGVDKLRMVGMARADVSWSAATWAGVGSGLEVDLPGSGSLLLLNVARLSASDLVF